MWPFWMPVVASARKAEKFCTKPTAAMVRASRSAESTPSSFSASRAIGWALVAPPTRPTAIGSSSEPARSPSLVTSQRVSLL